MSIRVTSINDLKVFTTQPHRCSYLEDRDATTLFIDPQARIDKHVYSQLSESGFRRSGEHLYHPHCQNCAACIPVRVRVNDFKASRQHKRILKRNADLTTTSPDDIDSQIYYDLYAAYIRKRHYDGDMYPPSMEQFRAFLTKEWGVTSYHAFWNGDELKAVAIVDEMDNGLSAVYTFFDPDDDKRSLGTYCILWQIELAISLQLPALYLGYWIRDCQKMNYKINFKPLELLVNGRWLVSK